MNNRAWFAYFLGCYIALRVFSFFYLPGSLANAALTALVLILVVYLLITKNDWAWFVIAAEILLGGAGNFLTLAGLSLRTCLLLTAAIIWTTQQIYSGAWRTIFNSDRVFIFTSAALLAAATASAAIGVYHGHSLTLIKSDWIPYTYLFYYLPFKQIWNRSEWQNIIKPLALAALVGLLVFSAFTFIFYSSGLFVLQDSYYHWFRDIAGGKITDLGLNFFRTVLNEQLLLAPALAFAFRNFLKKASLVSSLILLALLLILSVNLTRIYILAFLATILILCKRANFKQWLIKSALVLTAFIICFTATHLAASRGQSLGWELFGLRLQSIVAPKIEASSLSRLLLLPPILKQISINPIFGSGLGTTITVFSPVLNQIITTPQLDWGWLEITAELGIIGLIAWLATLYILVKKISAQEERLVLYAATSALVISTVTAPVIFHVLGIICLVTIFLFSAEPNRV